MSNVIHLLPPLPFVFEVCESLITASALLAVAVVYDNLIKGAGVEEEDDTDDQIDKTSVKVFPPDPDRPVVWPDGEMDLVLIQQSPM